MSTINKAEFAYSIIQLLTFGSTGLLEEWIIYSEPIHSLFYKVVFISINKIFLYKL